MRTVEGMITGPELSARLEVLKDQISMHLQGASKAWGDWLEHVRGAGEALQEAYERLGRRSKWSKWVARHCKLSLRSTRDYRRIFREWDNPDLVAARSSGGQPQSISGVLKILRGKSSVSKGDKGPDEVQADAIRKELRMHFAEELQDMRLEELQVLQKKFHDDIWFRICGVLAKAVVSEFGDEYYEHGQEPVREWAFDQARQRYQNRYFNKIKSGLRREGFKV